MKQARQIFRNALLLTAASLLIRTVGVWFQVAISNRAGPEVMGLFSLMSGVYGFALTLATSGIHLGVTRVITEAISRGREERVGAIMKKASAYALLCGGTAALLLFFGAERIGTRWLADSRTVPSLRLFALSLPLISLTSVFGGYFTAVRKTYKSAILQVLEQGVKIFFTMRLLAFYTDGSAEALLRALVLGGLLEEIFSFFPELLLFWTDYRRRFRRVGGSGSEGREMVRITLPMAFTALIRSGLLTLQHVLIPRLLKNSGSSHSLALISYGKIHSMALPIVLYPAALISSFAGLLIPLLAECRVREERKRIDYIVSRVFWLSAVFSIGVGGILACFSESFGELLYPNTGAGHYIRILAPLIPIMYLDTATDAMLKGLNQQLFSMKINIADAAISVLLVWLLIPRYGINGYLMSIYISETFNTVCSVWRLLSVTRVTPRLLKWVYLPLLCIVAATYVLHGISPVVAPVSASVLSIFCIATAAVYLLLLRLRQKDG